MFNVLVDNGFTSIGNYLIIKLDGIEIVLKNVVGVEVLLDNVLTEIAEQVVTFKNVGLRINLTNLLLGDVLLDMLIVLVVVDVFQDEVDVVVAASSLILGACLHRSWDFE